MPSKAFCVKFNFICNFIFNMRGKQKWGGPDFAVAAVVTVAMTPNDRFDCSENRPNLKLLGRQLIRGYAN